MHQTRQLWLPTPWCKPLRSGGSKCSAKLPPTCPTKCGPPTQRCPGGRSSALESFLAHANFHIDQDIVGSIVTDEIPPLRAILVLQRQINRPQFTDTDRTILAILSTVLKRSKLNQVMLIVQPATVIAVESPLRVCRRSPGSRSRQR